MVSAQPDSATERLLLTMCAEIAGRSQVAAACECGESVYSIRPEGHGLLLVLEDYAEGLRYHSRRLSTGPCTILAADQSLVDLDATKGVMGEFVVERLMTPYRPLRNEQLLRSIEVSAKERILREELTELVVEHGEMARELSIREEYLMLARLRRRARVFLPSARACVLLLDPAVRERNLSNMAAGYRAAIQRLVDAGLLRNEGSMWQLEDSFIDRVLGQKPVARVINIVQAGRRTLQAYLAHGRAAYLTPDVLTRELAHSVEQSLFSDIDFANLEDPRRYLSFKTDTGQVSLGERFSIESFAAKFRPGAVVTVTPLGNVLNEVYLISAGDERLVAKKFTDWHSFKWFTLGLVSLGTRFFSVSGKARLENEYATNRLLSRRGVRVPEVLHISLPDRVLVERYIDGLSLAELAKKAAAAKSMSERDLGVASEAGKVMAKTHSAGVAMGDSKPENFQRAVDDSVYCLDLEQARKSGDKSWDIAEFLYYSGHYVFPRIPSGGFKEYVAAFIDGYKELGDKDTLKRAAGVKYGRVFSLWTPPLAIHEVVRALRNAS